MPLSFYSFAPMEWLFGVGYLPGRVLMIVFALGCLVLALVSCLSLALVFVLLVVRSRVLAYGTSGIILLSPGPTCCRSPNLPATGCILVLCDSVEAAQAVWLAGGVVEPRSMYLPSTFRARSQG